MNKKCNRIVAHCLAMHKSIIFFVSNFDLHSNKVDQIFWLCMLLQYISLMLCLNISYYSCLLAFVMQSALRTKEKKIDKMLFERKAIPLVPQFFFNRLKFIKKENITILISHELELKWREYISQLRFYLMDLIMYSVVSFEILNDMIIDISLNL